MEEILLIVVTGGTGMIGSHIVNRLKNKFKLRCFVREKSDISNLDTKKIEIYTGSLFRKRDIEDCLVNSDTVIHVAGITHSNRRKDFEKFNYQITRNLLDVCKAKKIKLIFFSTANTLLKNESDYSISKKRAENAIIKSGVSYIILRPTLVYDDYGNNDLIKLIKIAKYFRIIPLIDKGKNLYQPVYVEDLCNLLEKVLDNNLRNTCINIGGGSIVSFKELLLKIAGKMKKRSLFVNIPVPFKIKPIEEFLEDRTVDNTKAESVMGRKLLQFDSGLDIIF